MNNIIYVILSTILLVAGLSITYWIHSQHQIDPVISPAALPVGLQTPLISIIVPARNEARNIQRCVTALLGQSYPNFEIIVVNDRSTDATPHLLAEVFGSIPAGGKPNFRVIQGDELPPGWAGKPHALHQGVTIAQGEWLCFVDADTFAKSDLLASAYLAASSRQIDLFSIFTDQELGSFWEKTILPLVFTALSVGFPASRVNDPARPDAIANGQFILIRRSVYIAIGGHQTIRDQIAEDKALAYLVKGAGYRLLVADGRQLARTRMYTSLPEIWEGWTKNIYLGLRDRLWLLLVGVVTGLLGAIALPLWLVWGTAWLVTDGGWAALLVVAESLAVWAYLIERRLQVVRTFGISSSYAFTLPLGALLFSAMMLASAYKVISGVGVTWKGRTYS